MSVNSDIKKLLLQGDNLNEALIKKYEKQLVALYQESLKNVRSEIANLFAKYGDEIDYSKVRGARLQGLQREIFNELNKLKNSKEVIKEVVQRGHVESYSYTSFALERTLQVDLNFSMLPSNAIQAATFNPYDKIKWSTRNLVNIESMKNSVRKEVTKGLINGSGYGDIAKKITQQLNIGATKAVRIAWTETARAQEAGRLASIDESIGYSKEFGMQTKKVWNATLDGKTRPNHGAMDGVSTDDTGKFIFTTMDGTTLYVAGPHLTGTTDDIACRCYTSLEFDNIPPKVRRDNITKEVIPYKTYNEWKSAKLSKDEA